jgi:hypothetical protein
MKNVIATIVAVIRSVRFDRMATTAHAAALRDIAHGRSMISVFANKSDWSDYKKSRVIELREKQIQRYEAVLQKANHLLFPTFVWFKVGCNEFGLSLAGLRCNFPVLARKYGEECEYAGNTLHYTNWMGSHWDF